MNSVLFFILLIAVSCVKSAVIKIDQVQIPGHEGKCYDNDGKIFYSKGEILEDTECIERKCLGFLESTGKVRIEVLTCPVVEAGPGCTVVVDPSKSYPYCCPQVVAMPSVEPKVCKQEKLESQ